MRALTCSGLTYRYFHWNIDQQHMSTHNLYLIDKATTPYRPSQLGVRAHTLAQRESYAGHRDATAPLCAVGRIAPRSHYTPPPSCWIIQRARVQSAHDAHVCVPSFCGGVCAHPPPGMISPAARAVYDRGVHDVFAVYRMVIAVIDQYNISLDVHHTAPIISRVLCGENDFNAIYVQVIMRQL